MLRLKGERGEDTRHESGEEVDGYEPLETDSSTVPDTEAEGGDPDAPEGEPEDDWAEEESPLPLRGLGIAAATFAPTFLAVLFGLPYLLGSSTPARVPGDRGATPPAAATAPLDPGASPDVSPSLGETLRRSLADRPNEPAAIAPRVLDEQASRDVDTRPRESSPREARSQAPMPSAPEPAPAPPVPETPAPPALPPAVSRPPMAPRPAVARSTPEPRATPETRRPAEWTPAAAFADRDAAGRLASSIAKQGYPVEVRQDGSSSRPWVVWIGAQPGGARRR